MTTKIRHRKGKIVPQRKVDGPYRVRKSETSYEVVYVTLDQVQSLLPRKVYSLRQTAYRSALELNKKWNKEQEQLRKDTQ